MIKGYKLTFNYVIEIECKEDQNNNYLLTEEDVLIIVDSDLTSALIIGIKLLKNMHPKATIENIAINEFEI